MAGAGAAGAAGLDGAWLRRLRTSAGLTQAQLAAQAAVGVRTVREVERGGVRPRAASLHRLAAALGVEAEQVDRLAYGAQPAARGSGAEERARPAADELHVDVLGPLAVRRGAHGVAIPSAMQRTLLGLLAVQPGRITGVEEIIDTLWDGAPPRTCRELVHSYVSSLRRLLAAPGAAPPLRREQTGYRLRLDPAGSDAARFTDLAERARRAAAAGEAQSARQLYGEALACWRGVLLAGEGAWRARHPAAITLAAQQIAVAVEWADIGLGMGAYARTAQVLQPLCAQEPLHEGLAARLMLAWAGEGRQSAALAIFSELRRRLDAELGVRPGQELREAHLRVLRGRLPVAARPVGLLEAEPAERARPEPPSAPAAAVPAQLPADAGGFAGRAAELRALDRLLVPAEGGAAPIAVLSGMAGVGKTALAVHWARAVRARFPDGQLYADLRGHTPAESARPLDVLAAFLGAFGVEPRAVPADPDQASALLRSLLDRRRVLVVLDNASGAEQVRPLLPASSGCVTLVTSRTRLGGLVARDGAELLTVQPLSAAESVGLLAGAVGDARARAEGAAVAEIAELCAHLPLALRITAANLATRPTHRIADHLARLSAAGGRLDALAVEGDPQTAVRAAFRLSCASLDPADLRLFQLLGLVPGPDATIGQAAAVAALDDVAARASLDRLADRNLLTEYLPGRFRLHDLVRLYAQELAGQACSGQERAEALNRLTAYSLAGAARAAGLLYPHLLTPPDAADDEARLTAASGGAGPDLPDARSALAWFEAHRPGLVALLVHLADTGAARAALVLGYRLNGYCLLRADKAHWPTVARTSLQAAAVDGDGVQLAMAWLQCGMATRAAGDHEAAAGHFTRSAAAARRAGWRAGEAVAINNLATVHWARGRAGTAIRLLGEALELHRGSGRRAGEAVTLANLGAAHLESAREAAPEAAREHLSAALGLLGQAWEVHREIGDARNEGDTVRLLAVVHRELGDDVRGLELAREALHRAHASGDLLYQAAAHGTLGTLLARTGEPRRALAEHERALALVRPANASRETAEALLDLAETHLRLGQFDDASLAAADAQILAGRAGSVVLARRARHVHARIAETADRQDPMTPVPAASPL